MSLILRNVTLVGDPENTKDIFIENDTIGAIVNHQDENNTVYTNSIVIDFDNALATPGLINSHDHLEFDLYPQLSSRNYTDYVDWSLDLHKSFPQIIENIESIPLDLRTQWGIYKNILSGVTTVIQHGASFKGFSTTHIPVVTKANNIHSVQLEKHWKRKLLNPFSSLPVCIHLGEGINSSSSKEIDTFIRWNYLKKRLIAVHGISMSAYQAQYFDALIWCPDSNHFLVNRTAPINQLKAETAILFGTDSTLTSTWNMFDHLRSAREMNVLSDKELYESTTSSPASVWKLPDRGIIRKGKRADVMIVRKKHKNPLNSFYATETKDILLLLSGGKIIFFDNDFFNIVFKDERLQTKYSRIKVGISVKYVIGNIEQLRNETIKWYPEIAFPIPYCNV